MRLRQKRRVLLPHILGQPGKCLLAQRDDLECIEFSNSIRQEEFQRLLNGYDAVHGVILGPTAFGRAELQAARGLQVVSRIGVGFDAVDVPLLTEAGIPVMICANANHRAVAEHTLAFMLGLAKRTTELNELVQRGHWHDRYEYLPRELDGQQVLIVGCGRIGASVARLCMAMGMDVRVYDPYVEAHELAPGVEKVDSLDAALPDADWVTLHCPKTAETKGMFSARRLRQLKRGAFLVNTARGGIVDEEALYHALIGRHLRGAALDVFSVEPPSHRNPLLSLPNVLASPHLAGVSREAVGRMAMLAVGNVLDVFDANANPDNAVNPQLVIKPSERMRLSR